MVYARRLDLISDYSIILICFHNSYHKELKGLTLPSRIAVVPGISVVVGKMGHS